MPVFNASTPMPSATWPRIVIPSSSSSTAAIANGSNGSLATNGRRRFVARARVRPHLPGAAQGHLFEVGLIACRVSAERLLGGKEIGSARAASRSEQSRLVWVHGEEAFDGRRVGFVRHRETFYEIEHVSLLQPPFQADDSRVLTSLWFARGGRSGPRGGLRGCRAWRARSSDSGRRSLRPSARAVSPSRWCVGSRPSVPRPRASG